MTTDRPSDDLHVLRVRRVSFRRLPNSFSCSLSRAVSFPTPRAGRHKKSLARRLRWSGRRIYDRASSLMLRPLRLRRGRLSTNIKKTEISRVVVRDSTHTTIRRVARERENDPSSHTNRLDLWTQWLALSSACFSTESELKENQCRRTVLGLVSNRSQPIQVIPIHRATVMT